LYAFCGDEKVITSAGGTYKIKHLTRHPQNTQKPDGDLPLFSFHSMCVLKPDKYFFFHSIQFQWDACAVVNAAAQKGKREVGPAMRRPI